jgi:hypothetical protein
VHFERLVIESGSETFTLDLHPRLTIVAGVGQLERDGLINELVSALGSGRSGVHLELGSDAGTRYTIFRPVGGRHCVVDIDHTQDVTEAFRAPDGTVNLLDRAGLNERNAKRKMRITEQDLASRSEQEDAIVALARLDQGRLWDVAWKVQDRENQLADVATSAGATVEDAEAFEQIERRHKEFEAAQAQHEQVRHLWFMVGGITAIGAVPAAVVMGPWGAIPLVLAAIVTTALSIVFWRRLESARTLEEQALEDAGAHSYLTFQINRVNETVASEQHRRAMVLAAEYHQAALVEWRLLAGEIPVEWAIERRREIRREATRLASDPDGMAPPPIAPHPEKSSDDLAYSLLRRLEELRTLGAGGESFPAFLDDPLVSLTASGKAQLLEQISAASKRQQIVLLTQDTDVAAWARVEALTGDLRIIEPANRVERPTGGDDTPKRTRHVAA